MVNKKVAYHSGPHGSSHSGGTVNRLKELNKLWFRLHMPREGDKIKFKIKGSNKEYEGKIIAAKRGKGQMNYKISSLHAPKGRTKGIEIVECNGIRFGRVDRIYNQMNQGYNPI